MFLLARFFLLGCLLCYTVHGEVHLVELKDLLIDLQSEVSGIRESLKQPDCSSSQWPPKNCTGFPGQGGILKKEDITSLAKSTGFSNAKITGAFKNFLRSYHDGKMTLDDFHEMMVGAITKEEDAVKMEKNVLRLYDTNRDNCIDFTEFMITLHIIGDQTENELFKKIFRVFDENDDRSISMKEMKKVVTDMQGLLKEKDQNVGSADYITSAAIVEMDKDKDGNITVDEFTTACKDEKEMCQMLKSAILGIFGI